MNEKVYNLNGTIKSQEFVLDSKDIESMENSKKLRKIINIQSRLNELSQDFIQVSLGAEFGDLEERKTEFKTLHNELRTLLGKGPRNYKNVSHETLNA